MKAFLYIIKKEIRSITRDRAGLITTIIIPIFSLLIFDKVISTDMHHVEVEAVIEKPSDRANEYLKPLRENDLFVYHGTTTSVTEGMRLFRQNKVDVLVVLGKDFDRQMDAPVKGAANPAVQIITDNSNTVIGTTANYYVQSALNPQQAGCISTRMLYNPGISSTYQFGVGIYALFLLILCVFGCASTMVREKEHHSIDSIIISSVSTWQLMAGKLVTHLILNCVLGTVGLLLTHYVIGLPINGSLWVLALLSLIFIITTMLLATFISLCSSSEANSLTTAITVVCLPMLNFSGIIFPIDGMPDWGQFVSNFTYARWYIDAARKIMLQGVDYTYIIKETCLLLVNTLAFLMLCLYKLKNDRWLR